MCFPLCSSSSVVVASRRRREQSFCMELKSTRNFVRTPAAGIQENNSLSGVIHTYYNMLCVKRQAQRVYIQSVSGFRILRVRNAMYYTTAKLPFDEFPFYEIFPRTVLCSQLIIHTFISKQRTLRDEQIISKRIFV